MALVFCGIFACLSAQASWPELPSIRLQAGSIESGSILVNGVDLRLEPGGVFALSAERVRDSESGVDVAGFELGGQVQEASAEKEVYTLQGALEYAGLQGDWGLSRDPGGWHATLGLQQQALVSVLEVLTGPGPKPEPVAWVKSGELSADLSLAFPDVGEPGLQWSMSVAGFSFDSPDGLYASEGLAFTFGGDAGFATGVASTANGAITSGEVLLDQVYASFHAAPLSIESKIEWPRQGPVVVGFSLKDDGAVALKGQALGKVRGEALTWDVKIDSLALQFPLAYKRYLESMAAAWTLDGLEVTGRVLWSGGWYEGAFHSGNLDIEDLSVVDTQAGRFALTGLYTKLRPGDHAFESTLEWRGLLFGPINLGDGQAFLDSEPGTLALAQPLDLSVLGGRLHLEQLRLLLPGSSGDLSGESDFRLKASLHDMEMAQLTAALGWPRFGGVISGDIPGASLDEGVLAVDGEIVMKVFDGNVTVNDLRVERPFGVLPSLAANIDVQALDLAQLTETFSFGNISGRLDGYVHDLRMLDWQPVAFDAWLGTPQQQEGSQGISRQAVNHLTTIGGGSATTALTSPIMRMFNNFSYKRLGLGCRLQNYACEIRGLSGDEGSVLLLEGAGIPKITIRAFNRQVDWPQMVSNLMAVGGENAIRIGSED